MLASYFLSFHIKSFINHKYDAGQKKAPKTAKFSEPLGLLTLVFSAGRKPASYVPFGFVKVQHLLYLKVQYPVDTFKPFTQILVDSTLGNAELFCRGADSSTVFNYVPPQQNGAFLDVVPQNHHSRKITVIDNMPEVGGIMPV
jgi:hypothetical protein